MDNELWTISRILQWTEQYFRSKGIESSRLDGEVLLSHVLGVNRIYLYTNFDRPMDKKELEQFRHYIKRRVEGYSVAAITGCKEFMGLSFHVNEHVLIPRPDTESLVEAVLTTYEQHPDQHILDICTGPGTILLSLLHWLGSATGVGIDISEEALTVAKENAHTFGLEEKCHFVKGDVIAWLQGQKVLDIPEKSFDIIVANPPYITTAEMATLSKEVLHEPHIALHGGDDGLTFYRIILGFAWKYLKPHRKIYLEIGAGQEEAVTKIAQSVRIDREPVYDHAITYVKDLNGIIRTIVLHYMGT